MKYLVHILLIVLVSVLVITYGALHAETIKTEGRFLDTASDYPITVAYVYDGCHHQSSEYCSSRKPSYHQNKRTLWNVSRDSELCAANVHFMAIDTSRNRIKNVKQFLSITGSDSFIVFLNGYIANYDYLSGTPTEQQLIAYIKRAAGNALTTDERLERQPGQCAQKCHRYAPCDTTQSWRGNPSWQVQGYYGVMGGEPPHSYGYAQAGAYSYGMGFRRLPN
jgi:hypothetical protein